MSFYPAERYQHDLELMLDPSRWPLDDTFFVKKWTSEGLEGGKLVYQGNLYYFIPDVGEELKGGPEVPETIVKNGWVAD